MTSISIVQYWLLLNCGIAAHKLPGYLNRSMVMIVFMFQVLLLSIINSAIEEQFIALKLFTVVVIESIIALLLMGLMWRRLRRLGRSETQEIFKTA